MLADEGRAYSSEVIAMIRAPLTSSRFSGPRQAAASLSSSVGSSFESAGGKARVKHGGGGGDGGKRRGEPHRSWPFAGQVPRLQIA